VTTTSIPTTVSSTSTTAPQNAATPNSRTQVGTSSNPTGLIVGIVVGILLLLGILLAIIACIIMIQINLVH
jgi:predicted lipid-binding transport protein (Tim44 family)